ncbi:beta/gamma crystallin domain-containing protein [Noviherbaspirillum sp. ST9]|uniref:beta/gamma crystallin domain-containing protein n=1 Tax=Noviherbaspirillum sp. ST9 TaxID=3401606 RepID=UPI003B587B8F
MTNLTKTCKTTLAAAALSVAFSPVMAGSADAGPLLAQAATQQQTPSVGASTDPANIANAPSGASGSGSASGTSGSSGTAASSGQSGQQGSSAQGGGTASASKGKSAQTASNKGRDAKAPVYLLVPVDVATNDNAMKNGCWAKLYSRDNYGGDMLTLVGPTMLADMDSTGFFGLNWDDRVESLELGPKASMTVYDNENYRDQVARFNAGQRVADVSKRVGLFDEFASLRIDCQQS